jgi:hydrogenase maturation protease
VTEAIAETLVVGLGNLLRGDDGIGVRVAQALMGRPLPAGVEVVDGGTQGLALVNLLEGRRRAILVDAANVGRAPGEFVRFTPDEVNLLSGDPAISIHDAGLGDALLLARVLGVLPQEIVILGVQPANLDWDQALSPPVHAALPGLVAAVLEELDH